MAGAAYGPGNNEIVDVVVPVPNAPSLGFVGRLLATLRNVPIQLDAELVSSSGGHAVLYIHGGGWTIPGSQVQFSQVTPWARQGLCVFSMNYPLTNPWKNRFPAALVSALRCVAWIRSQGFESVSIVGESAGGQVKTHNTSPPCVL